MPTLLGTVASRRKDTRRLAGNLDSTDISDADLDEIIERYDNWVMVKTKKTDWVITDKEWHQVLNASNMMAAAEILNGIPRESSKKTAGELRVAARDIIKSINNKDDEVQRAEKMNIITAGPNITDELDSKNYIPDASETY